MQQVAAGKAKGAGLNKGAGVTAPGGANGAKRPPIRASCHWTRLRRRNSRARMGPDSRHGVCARGSWLPPRPPGIVGVVFAPRLLCGRPKVGAVRATRPWNGARGSGRPRRFPDSGPGFYTLPSRVSKAGRPSQPWSVSPRAAVSKSVSTHPCVSRR